MLQAVDFRTLRGRVVVVSLFILVWAMEAARRSLYDGVVVVNAVWQSLGFLVGLAPLFGLVAWLLWRLAFRKAKGLFPFSLAAVMAGWAAYYLVK